MEIDNNSLRALAKTPLGIFGILLGLVEVVATVVLPFIDDSLQVILIWFIVGFPVLVLLSLVYLIANHHVKLYPPSEYKNEDNFLGAPKQGSYNGIKNFNEIFQSQVNDQIEGNEVEQILTKLEKPDNNEKQDKSIDNIKTIEDLEFALITKAIEGDFEKSKQHLEDILKISSNETEKIKYNALYQYLSYSRGKTEALNELLSLANQSQNDSEAKSIVLSYIGNCYAKSEVFEKAVDYFQQALGLTQKDNKRARLITEIAECFFMLDQRPFALDNLIKSIPGFSNSESLIILYEKLVDLFERDKQFDLKALALEMLLNIKPNDTDLLFKAGFTYSKDISNHLAYLHYRNLLKYIPKNSSALNNIAVTLGELKLPINSITNYKKSWELKETLSAANLASKFVEAGFIDEARDILKQASCEESPDPQVGRIISSVNEKEKQESSELDNIVTMAIDQQRFFLEFARNYFMNSEEVDFVGVWQMPDKTQITINVENNLIHGISDGTYYKNKFEGKIYKSTAIVKNFKSDFISSTDKDPKYNDDGKGYLFFSSNDTLKIMNIKDKKHIYVKLTRVNSYQNNQQISNSTVLNV